MTWVVPLFFTRLVLLNLTSINLTHNWHLKKLTLEKMAGKSKWHYSCYIITLFLTSDFHWFFDLGQIFHRPWWRPFPIYFGLLTQQEIGVTRKLSGNAKIGHGSGLLPITKVGTHFLSIFPRYQSSCHNLFYLFSMECSLEFRDGIHITKVQDSLGNSTLLLF